MLISRVLSASSGIFMDPNPPCFLGVLILQWTKPTYSQHRPITITHGLFSASDWSTNLTVVKMYNSLHMISFGQQSTFLVYVYMKIDASRQTSTFPYFTCRSWLKFLTCWLLWRNLLAVRFSESLHQSNHWSSNYSIRSAFQNSGNVLFCYLSTSCDELCKNTTYQSNHINSCDCRNIDVMNTGFFSLIQKLYE